MKAEIAVMTAENIDRKAIARGGEILKNGGLVAAPYSFIIKGTELVDIINLVPFFYVKLAHNKTDV